MSKVLIGKEGWLFLINDTNQGLHNHITGKVGSFNIDQFIKQYQISCEYYKSKNIEFHMGFFPDKCVVYSRYLPSSYDNKEVKRPIIDLIKSKSNEFIDFNNVLIDDKYGLTFFSKDTHINYIGGYLCYEYLCKEYLKCPYFKYGDIEWIEESYKGDLTKPVNVGNNKNIDTSSMKILKPNIKINMIIRNNGVSDRKSVV